MSGFIKHSVLIFTLTVSGVLYLGISQLGYETVNNEVVDLLRKKDRNLVFETERAFMERMKLRMQQRKAKLKQACVELGLERVPFRPQAMMTVQSYNWINCRVQKAGSTNLAKLVSQLLGENDIKELSKINPAVRLSGFHGAEALSLVKYKDVNQMKGFIKTITVREPLVRLVSAFTSKVENYQGGSDSRKNNTALAPWRSRDDMPENVTFDAFIQHVLYKHKAKSPFEGHWSVYNDACQPCQIEYDVICKLESITEDSRYMLNLIGAPRNVSFQAGYSSNGSMKNSLANATHWVKTLDPTTLKRLHKKYEMDYKLFDYDLPEYLML
uniref:carbohydrate sulfotransferase 11-like n=1 Tax=Ciona intestinalis TaxID=7719 RepID=UPI0002B8D92B|nr:carbohydrate sulfotransferase 11-like [Ciona intestinalis]|eukprot:XP_004226180.1 carbohydrate sulfotransferase 11-like [Ciona intestinalis]